MERTNAELVKRAREFVQRLAKLGPYDRLDSDVAQDMGDWLELLADALEASDEPA